MTDELLDVPSPGVPLWFGDADDPAVVMLHDRFGRVPELEAVARRVSSQGFRVALPDLYDGVCTTDADVAARLHARLDLETSLGVIDDCLMRCANPRRAVVGFSTGGWLALVHAQTGVADAVVAYYSTLGPERASVIPCAMLLHFAEADEWDSGEEPEEFLDRCRDHGTPVSSHEYPGTRHGFANPALEQFDPAAANLALARTVGFLQRELHD